jgi:uncharacterized damage-inducible protein DinB
MAPTSIDFADFFGHLVKARGRLLEWVREQPSAVYTRTFQIGLGSIRATLVHIAETRLGIRAAACRNGLSAAVA